MGVTSTRTCGTAEGCSDGSTNVTADVAAACTGLTGPRAQNAAPKSPTLSHNAAKLSVDFSEVDAVVISHLHPDHMGGMTAFKSNSVRIPKEADQ